jgi:hypothetical protein
VNSVPAQTTNVSSLNNGTVDEAESTGNKSDTALPKSSRSDPSSKSIKCACGRELVVKEEQGLNVELD